MYIDADPNQDPDYIPGVGFIQPDSTAAEQHIRGGEGGPDIRQPVVSAPVGAIQIGVDSEVLANQERILALLEAIVAHLGIPAEVLEDKPKVRPRPEPNTEVEADPQRKAEYDRMKADFEAQKKRVESSLESVVRRMVS